MRLKQPNWIELVIEEAEGREWRPRHREANKGDLAERERGGVHEHKTNRQKEI